MGSELEFSMRFFYYCDMLYIKTVRAAITIKIPSKFSGDFFKYIKTMRSIFIFVCILLLISCSKRGEKTHSLAIQKIPAFEQEKLDPSELFTLSEIIKLEFCDECIIAEVHKILTDETGMYILDKTIGKTVKKFNWKGELIFSINEDGEGLGKYVLPFDIELVGGKISILDVNQRKILFYDGTSGSFLEEKRFGSFQAKTFAYLGGNSYAYHLDGREFGAGKHYLGLLRSLDQAGGNPEWVFDFGRSDYMEVGQEFTHNQDGILFSKSMNDTIYHVNDSGFVPKYRFDFGKKSLTDEIRNAEIFEAREKIMTSWPHFHWGNVVENSNHLFFLWSGDRGQTHLSFFEKKQKKVFKLEGSDYFPSSIFQLDDQELLAYVTPEEYMENDIEFISKVYSNPIILRYAFKKD